MVRNWVGSHRFPGKLSNTTGIGNVTFTPNPGFSGVTTFTYKLGNLFNTNIETTTVTVIGDDLEPEEEFPHVFSTLKRLRSHSTTISHFNSEFSDWHCTQSWSAWVAISQPATRWEYGDLTANNVLTYTPKQHFHGDDEFVLRYCLPNGHCYSSKIRIEVWNGRFGALLIAPRTVFGQVT